MLHRQFDIKYNQQICWHWDLKSLRSRQFMLSYASSSSLLKRASCLKLKFDEIKKVGIHNERKIQQSQEDNGQRYGPFSQMTRFSGLLRGQWKNQNKLQSICYGSGIAISKRMVLTCAHSIYHSDNQLVCDSISFIPNHEQGKLKKNKKIFHSTDQNYIKFKPLKEGQKFGKHPLSEDLALIYLSEDLQLQNFPSVGVYKNTKIQQKSSIMICGYPSIGYQRCSNLNKIDFSRVTLQGKLVNILGDTIYHQLDTKTGHSGSAIFGINPQTDQPTILGIHTHKGSRNNSGVYLNYSNLKRLAKYQIQFGIAHSQYQMDIKFPEQIKKEAWNDLSENHKRKFRNRLKYYQKMGSKLEEEQSIKLIELCCQYISKSFTSQQEISEMSKIHNFYQEELDIEKNNLQNIMERNFIMKQKIVKNIKLSKCKDIFSKWQQIERSFLESFTLLHQKSNNYPFKSIKISNDTNKIFSNYSKQFIQIKDKTDRNDKIEIFCLKIAPINHHLNFLNQINQIYLGSSQNQQ